MFFFHFLNVNICFLVFAERHVLASRLKSITTDKQPARWPCGRQRYPSKRAVQLAVGSAEATRWPWGWFLPKTPARSTAQCCAQHCQQAALDPRVLHVQPKK